MRLAACGADGAVVNFLDGDLAMPAIYGRAEALLFPSWIEGFGLPLVESMACGTPVITSGTSAMPEVAGPSPSVWSVTVKATYTASWRFIICLPANR